MDNTAVALSGVVLMWNKPGCCSIGIDATLEGMITTQ